MNVQELIDVLSNIENKSLKVCVFSEGDLGGELTEIHVDNDEVLLG
ncbi:hypothetical protein [Lactococcus formosensis]